jgi:transcription initiation factor IIE alpha subunit
MKTIPCDYVPSKPGRQCKDGKLLIYGEMGGPPPETITCPKCGGDGTIEVPESDILQKIAELTDERDEIDKEIEEWKAYLA